MILKDLLSLHDSTKLQEASVAEELSSEELADIAAELEDVADEMLSSIAQLKSIMRKLPRADQEEAKGYWLAQLEIAIGGDHGYMSRGPSLNGLIDRLRNERHDSDFM